MIHSIAKDGDARMVSFRYYLARRIFWILVGPFQALRNEFGARHGRAPVVMEFPTLCANTYPVGFFSMDFLCWNRRKPLQNRFRGLGIFGIFEIPRFREPEFCECDS